MESFAFGLAVCRAAPPSLPAAPEFPSGLPFGPRAYAEAVSFRERLWILGGMDASGTPLGEVGFSFDGVRWFCPAKAETFPPRTHHAVAVFGGFLWVSGGWNGSIRLADVWQRREGIHWERVADAPFGPRQDARLIPHGGSLWLIGGFAGGRARSDVWRSEDGTAWAEVARDAFAPRFGHGAASFKGSLWVAGGRGMAVLFPTCGDPPMEERMTQGAPFGALGPLRFHVLEGRLLLVPQGGSGGIWWTAGGRDWLYLPVGEGARFAATAVHEGNLWSPGGYRAGSGAMAEVRRLWP